MELIIHDLNNEKLENLKWKIEKKEKIAIAIDVRNEKFIKQLNEKLEIFEQKNIDYKIIYLDARTEVLLSRYELSRRKHPLNLFNTLISNIEAERKIMENLKTEFIIWIYQI